MIRGLGIVTGGLLMGACSVVGVRSGTEQPAYQVVDRLKAGVEIRRYAPRLAAETTVPTSDGQAGRGQAFRRLADFIFGANRAQAKVAMTAPVQFEAGPSKIAMTAPVVTQARDDSLTMRFFMPASFTLETLPAPLDPAIRIVAVPEETLAVLRFSGSTGRAAVTAREAELSRILAGSSWQPQGEPVAQFYDPPWTLPFLRRNEVAVAVVGPG
jgi:hypothetical protein